MSRSFSCAAIILLLSACGTAARGNDADAALASARNTSQVRSTVAESRATSPSPTAGRLETDFAQQLATILVTHATLDGSAVTGVRAIDKCHTAFATKNGETVIDWTRAGNAAPRDVDGREITRLSGTDGDHVMSVELGDLPEPAGNAANRSSGAFGQLVLECAG